VTGPATSVDDNAQICVQSSLYLEVRHRQAATCVVARYVNKNGLTIGLDRLCGLVVRVLGYRYGGPGSIPGTIKKK
jgi:hypothetical protein